MKAFAVYGALFVLVFSAVARVLKSTARSVSLMPVGPSDAMTPTQIANIIAFLRLPPSE